MSDIDKPGVFPIRHLLRDPEVTEIMLNGPNQVFVEKGGVMHALPPVFADAQQMFGLVDNLIAKTGRPSRRWSTSGSTTARA